MDLEHAREGLTHLVQDLQDRLRMQLPQVREQPGDVEAVLQEPGVLAQQPSRVGAGATASSSSLEVLAILQDLKARYSQRISQLSQVRGGRRKRGRLKG